MTSKSSIGSKEIIDGFTVGHLLLTAEKIVKTKTEQTAILDAEAEDRIPKFSEEELFIGRVLGRGGFCVVNEITKISLMPSKEEATGKQKKLDVDDEFQIHNIVQDRDFMNKYCIRSGKDARYAIKKLQHTTKKDAQTFINGVVDLAIEARFLSVIRHSNIIKMRAMGVGSPYDTTFFVILDKLYDILSTRVAKWKKRKPGGIGKLLDRGGKKELAFWVERLTCAYDLACAIKYLHDLNIVYRDIKPDNIGFDVRGDVKIFDFGLAKEFDPDTRAADGTFKMTGDTGSPRYMAVEIALNKPYNETCDVYSFCILLWQILAMETPFEGYTMSMFDKKVVHGGARPRCDPKWPEKFTNAMRTGWDEDISGRPSMGDIATILRDEINKNSDDEVNDIMDASRKSTISLQNGR